MYGVKKMHAALTRKGLRHRAAVRGVHRSRKVFTTRPDPTAAVPADRVKRHFFADQPNSLWVVNADLGNMPMFSGKAQVGSGGRRFLYGNRRWARHRRTHSSASTAPLRSRADFARGSAPAPLIDVDTFDPIRTVWTTGR